MLLPAQQAPQAWQPPTCMVRTHFLRGLSLKGKFMFLFGPSHLAVDLVRGAFVGVVTESTDCSRLLHIKSHVSISFLSFLESVCPEEVGILPSQV